jgi:hypothetical protein
VKRLHSRPSSIDKLDPEIKRLISDLRIEYGWTIDQIREKLEELGKPISRSALARHTKSIEEIGRDLRHSREMAKVLIESVDPGDEAKVASLNIELAHAALLRLQTVTVDGELTTLDAKEAMFLSSAIKNLVGAGGQLDEIRRKAKAEQKRESAETARTAATSAGLSKATVDQIYRAVLGVEG